MMSESPKKQPSRNYQKELDRILAAQPAAPPPRLLLHACCAPCGSYVLEYLSRYFEITVLFYNPNIYPSGEYEKRVSEMARLIGEMPFRFPVRFQPARYEPEEFYAVAAGLEQAPEGGARCERCYELRLRETARAAGEGGYDFFTTTLTVSPLKSARKLNEIGERIGCEYGVPFLTSDFKKRGGYERSIQLSREYGLYRQNYCGCRYSLRQRPA